MPDRRHISRWQTDCSAKVKFAGAEKSVACKIRNINFKGLQISLGHRLHKDTLLKLHSISLSDQCCLDNVEVWVVWCKSRDLVHTYGCYFSKIKDGDKEKIYKFIHANYPQQLHKIWWQELREQKGGEVVKDRRLFARFLVSLPLKFFNIKNYEKGEVQTRDICAKGIGLISDEEMQPSTALEMELQIPEKEEPLRTRGEIVWSKAMGPNKFRSGVKLDEADLMGVSRVIRAS